MLRAHPSLMTDVQVINCKLRIAGPCRRLCYQATLLLVFSSLSLRTLFSCFARTAARPHMHTLKSHEATGIYLSGPFPVV